MLCSCMQCNAMLCCAMQECSLSSWQLIEPKAYNTILAALSRAGRWEEAVLLLKEMETRAIPRDAVSYACLIAA